LDILCFFLPLPPPISTLFPYTTLFRSLFLSQMSPTQLHKVLGNGPLKRYTDRTITSLDALEKALRKIRADGVGTDIGEYLEGSRSEEHTSELQSPYDLVCRLLLEKKKK